MTKRLVRLLVTLAVLFGSPLTAIAQSQQTVQGIRAIIGTTGTGLPCWYSSGSAAPSSANAPDADCGEYVRSSVGMYYKPAGTATWQLVVTGPAGSNTQIQYNNSGAFGADANLTWGAANKTLTLDGTLGTGMLLGAVNSDHQGDFWDREAYNYSATSSWVGTDIDPTVAFTNANGAFGLVLSVEGDYTGHIGTTPSASNGVDGMAIEYTFHSPNTGTAATIFQIEGLLVSFFPEIKGTDVLSNLYGIYMADSGDCTPCSGGAHGPAHDVGYYADEFTGGTVDSYALEEFGPTWIGGKLLIQNWYETSPSAGNDMTGRWQVEGHTSEQEFITAVPGNSSTNATFTINIPTFGTTTINCSQCNAAVGSLGSPSYSFVGHSNIGMSYQDTTHQAFNGGVNVAGGLGSGSGLYDFRVGVGGDGLYVYSTPSAANGDGKPDAVLLANWAGSQADIRSGAFSAVESPFANITLTGNAASGTILAAANPTLSLHTAGHNVATGNWGGGGGDGAWVDGTGTVAGMSGWYGEIDMNAAGTLTQGAGLETFVGMNAGAAGELDAVWVHTPYDTSVPPTTAVGIDIEDQTWPGSTNNFALRYLAPGSHTFEVYADGTVQTSPVAFASLPASPHEGMMVMVNNSNTATWGATITGTGTNHVMALYDGVNWTVMGK